MPNVDETRMWTGFVGVFLLLMAPLGQLLLIYGWEKNFRLLLTRQWLQEFWLYILLILGLLVFIIPIALNSTRGPAGSFLANALAVSINPLWFPISLLAFGSFMLIPLTTSRQLAIFGGMNWFALILLVVIPFSYSLLDDPGYSPSESLWIPSLAVFTFFLNITFAFISLFGSKWSRRTRSVIAVAAMVGFIFLSVIIVDGLNYWAANVD